MHRSIVADQSDPTTGTDDLRLRVVLFLSALRSVFRALDVDAENGAVRVAGTLRSFYERQLAVACIRRVAGVRQVVDMIQVAS